MFSTLSMTEMIIFVTFDMSSADPFNLVWSKILWCANALIKGYTSLNTSSVTAIDKADTNCSRRSTHNEVIKLDNRLIHQKHKGECSLRHYVNDIRFENKSPEDTFF